IHWVFLYDPDRERLIGSMKRFLEDPRQWPLLYVEGYPVFGWRDPADAETGSPRGRQWVAEELAFRPREEKKAPPRPAVRAPQPREWFEAFWKPAPARAADQDEATVYLMHARLRQESALDRHRSAWLVNQAAAMIGAARGWSGTAGLVDARLRLTRIKPPTPGPGMPEAPELISNAMQMDFVRQRDDAPPAILYLAIRAARRALAINPDNAQAYLVLGESYMRLL